MTPTEILKKAKGLKFTSEDGDTDELELFPPLAPDEIDKLQAKLPCRIPEEIRELLFRACQQNHQEMNEARK